MRACACRWLGDPFGEGVEGEGLSQGPKRVSLPYLAALERCIIPHQASSLLITTQNMHFVLVLYGELHPSSSMGVSAHT